MTAGETSGPAVFPDTRDCPFDPPAAYSWLRETKPISRGILPSGAPVWLITSYEYVRQILADPRISSNREQPGFPLLMQAPPEILHDLTRFSRSLIGVDAPEHTVRRRLVAADFTPKRAHVMRPTIQTIVDDCVDDLLASKPPVDLVPALASRVSSLVICELLGVPAEDREFLQRKSAVLLDSNVAPATRIAANRDITEALEKLVRAKESVPTDDVLGRLVVKNNSAGAFTHEELVNTALLLLVAGHETTANMISLGVVALLENPDLVAELRADHRLIPPMVEELLRYLSVVEIGVRVATSDIEIGGETIRAGEGLVALVGTANRDGTVFPNADKIDIRRRRARGHLAFGHGPHLCLGQHLARVELEIVFQALLTRLPGLRLASRLGELRIHNTANTCGFREVPVTW